MFRRFGARRAFGSSARSATPGPTPQSILGANLAEIWYAQDAIVASGDEVSSVTGRLSGTAMFPYLNPPIYDSSDPLLNGKPTVMLQDSTGDNALVLLTDTLDAALLPANERPFMWSVGRCRDLDSTVHGIFGVGAVNWYLQTARSGSTAWFSDLTTVSGSFNAFTSGSVPVTTSSMLLGAGSTNTSPTLCINGTLFPGRCTTPTVLPNAAGVVVMGGAADFFDYDQTNYNASVWGVCHSTPTSDQLAALSIWAQLNYSTSAPPPAPPTPRDILSGIVVEMDPRNVALSGTLITAFTNVTGAVGVITASGPTAQATWLPADIGFNNEPVAHFTGSTSAGTAKFYSLPNLSSITGSAEAFVVLRTTFNNPAPPAPPSVTYQGLWYTGATSATLYAATPSNTLDGFAITARQDYGAETLALNTPHIYNVHAEPALYSAYQSLKAGGDGNVFINVSGVTMSLPSTPRFGASSTAAAWFNGKLAYMCICDHVQTSQQRANMISYLKLRFNIA